MSLYIDGSGGYTIVYLHQNSSSGTLKTGVFWCTWLAQLMVHAILDLGAVSLYIYFIYI